MEDTMDTKEMKNVRTSRSLPQQHKDEVHVSDDTGEKQQ